MPRALWIQNLISSSKFLFCRGLDDSYYCPHECSNTHSPLLVLKLFPHTLAHIVHAHLHKLRLFSHSAPCTSTTPTPCTICQSYFLTTLFSYNAPYANIVHTWLAMQHAPVVPWSTNVKPVEVEKWRGATWEAWATPMIQLPVTHVAAASALKWKDLFTIKLT